METFFISDAHFFHDNVLKLDRRPFSSIEEMHTEMIKRWNDRVTNKDIVYTLGDMCWLKANDERYYDLLSQLRGKKIVIRGNHTISSFPQKLISAGKIMKVCDIENIKFDGTRIQMCHYPMPFYKHNHAQNSWMFYGHLHMTDEYFAFEKFLQELRKDPDKYGSCRCVNVGVMLPYMNYEPRTFYEIVEGYEKYRLGGLL